MSRTLHLLDSENLAESSNCTIEAVQHSLALYTDLFDDSGEDLRIVASSHHNAEAVFFGSASISCQRLIKSGQDGADLALIQACKEQIDQLAVTHVVIGSGDHIFLDLLQELQARGIQVTVVAIEGQVSTRLMMAANQVFLLPSTQSENGVNYDAA